MQQACLETPSTMLTVVGLDHDTLQAIINSSDMEGEACIANHLFPRGYVISGSVDRVEMIRKKAEELGATMKEVKVSGAFHSRLMSSAVEKLDAVLQEIDLSLPSIPVYSNVTGLPYSSVAEIKTGLAQQVTSPVPVGDYNTSHDFQLLWRQRSW